MAVGFATGRARTPWCSFSGRAENAGFAAFPPPAWQTWRGRECVRLCALFRSAAPSVRGCVTRLARGTRGRFFSPLVSLLSLTETTQPAARVSAAIERAVENVKTRAACHSLTSSVSRAPRVRRLLCLRRQSAPQGFPAADAFHKLREPGRLSQGSFARIHGETRRVLAAHPR